MTLLPPPLQPHYFFGAHGEEPFFEGLDTDTEKPMQPAAALRTSSLVTCAIPCDPVTRGEGPVDLSLEGVEDKPTTLLATTLTTPSPSPSPVTWSNRSSPLGLEEGREGQPDLSFEGIDEDEPPKNTAGKTSTLSKGLLQFTNRPSSITTETTLRPRSKTQ